MRGQGDLNFIVYGLLKKKAIDISNLDGKIDTIICQSTKEFQADNHFCLCFIFNINSHIWFMSQIAQLI